MPTIQQTQKRQGSMTHRTAQSAYSTRILRQSKAKPMSATAVQLRDLREALYMAETRLMDAEERIKQLEEKAK